MPTKDIPSATSTFALVRTVAGAIGISLGSAIFSTEGQSRLRHVPGAFDALNINSHTSLLQINVNNLENIQPPSLKQDILVRRTSLRIAALVSNTEVVHSTI